MHTITILHRILSTSFPEIHAKRLASLLAAVVNSWGRNPIDSEGTGLRPHVVPGSHGCSKCRCKVSHSAF